MTDLPDDPLSGGPSILVGRSDGQHLLVRVLRRRRPAAMDFWDGNWVDAEVEVVAGASGAWSRAR